MYAVIMAGGGGTRLWPMSRRNRPKPFLPLLDGGSLLQATVARLSPLIEPHDVFVVTDGRYGQLVREQLPEVPPQNVVAEPFGRNTAAAVALAAAAIDRPDADVMVVLPADHQVADAAGFRDALEAAAARAETGDLVTLGIQPSGPETGYGYVVAFEVEPEAETEGWARNVERFEEKPTVDRANALLATQRAYWNAGIFIWRRDAVLAELGRHAPEILEPIRAALKDGRTSDELAPTYQSLRSAPIDIALLEPASLDGKVAVVPVDVGWSDLGSWAALLDALSTREGAVELIGEGSRHLDAGSGANVLVSAQGGRVVATVGLDDVIVVDTPDALLVVRKDRAQDVKKIVDQLAAEGHEDLL